MPPYSAWPAVTALTLAGVFAMLVMRHYWIALAFLAAGGLALLAGIEMGCRLMSAGAGQPPRPVGAGPTTAAPVAQPARLSRAGGGGWSCSCAPRARCSGS